MLTRRSSVLTPSTPEASTSKRSMATIGRKAKCHESPRRVTVELALMSLSEMEAAPVQYCSTATVTGMAAASVASSR